MTALERAARAAHDVDQTPYGSSAPMPESWRLNKFRYVNIARAVLMAVRGEVCNTDFVEAIDRILQDDGSEPSSLLCEPRPPSANY